MRHSMMHVLVDFSRCSIRERIKMMIMMIMDFVVSERAIILSSREKAIMTRRWWKMRTEEFAKPKSNREWWEGEKGRPWIPCRIKMKHIIDMTYSYGVQAHYWHDIQLWYQTGTIVEAFFLNVRLREYHEYAFYLDVATILWYHGLPPIEILPIQIWSSSSSS